MHQGTFSVIDTETTGFDARGQDRIAEIAIVTVTGAGEILDRWETLINPDRDLGKTSLHGIRAAETLDAPLFGDLADEVAWRLSGTVPVAHNLDFDARFLDAELARAGIVPPVSLREVGLCTMRMAHEFLPGAGRRLQDCCDALGIDLTHAHTAGDDAEATAHLLGHYLHMGRDVAWEAHLRAAERAAWHTGEPAARRSPVLRGRPSESAHFLEKVLLRVPEYTGPAEHEQYLALLDRALLDRHLSRHETSALVALANDLGISRTTIAELHSMYFEQLVDAAWADGVVTDAEWEDIQTIGRILDVPEPQVSDALVPREATGAAPSSPALAPGAKVVLTGDMSRPRPMIEEALSSAGYTPRRAVTKQVQLLVAADPGTISGKARKARDYGIPVVGEDYLWNTVLVE